MKNFLLLIAFSLFSFVTQSQVITGVYTGKMEVDSPKYTVDFELTLKEKDGKLFGYCHRLFIIEDVLYYNLVKVTARVADSVLIVEDEKSVSNNFKEKTSAVKTVMFFKIQTDNDTVSVMPGEWSTSRTKRYLPITGSIAVRRERNYLATQLYSRLEDKKLAKEMLFEENVKTQPAIVSVPVKTEAKPTTITPEPTKTDVVTSPQKQETTQQIVSNMPKPTTALKDSKQQPSVNTSGNQPPGKPTNTTIASNQTKQPTNNPNGSKPPAIATSTTPAKDTLQAVVHKTDVALNPSSQVNKQPAGASNDAVNKPGTVANQQTTTQKPTVASNQPQQTVVAKPVSTQPQPTKTNPVTSETKPVATVVVPPTAVQQTQTEASISTVSQTTKENKTNQPVTNGKPPVISNPTITKRTTEIIEALEVTGDSVILSLYDNGEIDGDTVSIFLNNDLVLAKVGLRANAYKHTIALQPGEVVQLTLFAENLGAIPPNTGLLVVTTNDQRYQVHFTSTLNKSSSIVIKRKE